MTVEISVVICTRNRAASLARTLEHFTRLTRPAELSWEVLIADNASTDETARVIRDFAAFLPIRHITVPQRGASRARNKAIESAGGRFIFITDDDCLPAPDWLTVGHRLIAPDPRRIIGGRLALADPHDLPVCLREGDQPESLRDLNKIGGFCLSANLVCGRAVLQEIGAFDNRLGPGTPTLSNEDADLVYRAFRAAIPVRYEPSLLVLHAHGRDTLAQADRLSHAYATGDGAMAMKYLLLGDLRPLRPLYWDFRSLLGSWGRGRPLPELRRQARILRGAWLFLKVRNQPTY